MVNKVILQHQLHTHVIIAYYVIMNNLCNEFSILYTNYPLVNLHFLIFAIQSLTMCTNPKQSSISDSHYFSYDLSEVSHDPASAS